jgi:hypothetical protein
LSEVIGWAGDWCGVEGQEGRASKGRGEVLRGDRRMGSGVLRGTVRGLGVEGRWEGGKYAQMSLSDSSCFISYVYVGAREVYSPYCSFTKPPD